jgi:hypothetical protein
MADCKAKIADKQREIAKYYPMHLGRPKKVHTASPKQVHTAGPKQVHTAGPKQFHTAGPKHVHTAGSKQVHTAGPKQVHTAGPKQVHTAGPKPVHDAGYKKNSSETNVLVMQLNRLQEQVDTTRSIIENMSRDERMKNICTICQILGLFRLGETSLEDRYKAVLHMTLEQIRAWKDKKISYFNFGGTLHRTLTIMLRNRLRNSRDIVNLEVYIWDLIHDSGITYAWIDDIYAWYPDSVTIYIHRDDQEKVKEDASSGLIPTKTSNKSSNDLPRRCISFRKDSELDEFLLSVPVL